MSGIEVLRSLQELLDATEGVETIMLTDADGVTVAVAGDELKTRSGLMSAQQSTAEQIAKLNVGTARSLLFVYDKSQVPPLTVYVSASAQTNSGMLYAMRERLETIVGAIASELPEIMER